LKAHARGGDALYRYGGEEFLCIFAEQSLESGLLAAERMRTGIQDLAVVHPTNPLGVLTMSGGVAILESGGRGSSSHVLKQADEALYRAKRLGRNRVEPAEVAAPVMASADRAPIRLDGPRRTSPSPR
jgi:diguanylate cyclase (GGDEF)-like protein